MTTESRVLLFFIDGLGIGEHVATNPLHQLDEATPLAVFKNESPEIYLDSIVVPTDPRLGVEGRPQSASGQTTILTGVNAPQHVGYHKQGFPNKALLEIIKEKSIFKQLLDSGVKPVTFANAYTKRFFDERPRWVSATTAAMEAARLPFRTITDMKNGRAVFADFTNRLLIERGEEVEERSEAEAGRALARVVQHNRFTLYEYFITDKVGHLQDMDAARVVLTRLALFIRELLSHLDLNETTVILTSDHGNIEDLSSRNHTLNDVPTIIWGNRRHSVAGRINSLTDITPAILQVLTTSTEPNAHVSRGNG